MSDPSDPKGHEPRTWWPYALSVGVSVITALITFTLSSQISARNAERGREARRDLTRSVCSIVVAYDDNSRESPPETELGKKNAADLQVLRVSLGCPPRVP